MHTPHSPHLIHVHYPAEYSLAALGPVFITVAVIETFQQLPTMLLTKKSTKLPQCTFLEKTQDYIRSSKRLAAKCQTFNIFLKISLLGFVWLVSVLFFSETLLRNC